MSQTISSQSSVISSQAGDISAKLAVIAGLNSTIQSLNGHIDQLNSQVSADLSQIQSLNATVAADNTQISTLQAQVTQDQSQIASLEGEITTLNNQVASLQGIVNLEVSQVIVSSHTYQITSNTCVDVATVPNTNAGYLLVKFNATSTSIVILATDQGGCTSSAFDNPIVYIFPSGSSGTYSIPMAPVGSGTTVSVANAGTTTASVTVSITEYT